MTAIAPQDLLAQQQWRYATKAFDPARTIPAATWDALEECLVLSPSSYGLQPWKFQVITDKALRGQLLPKSWNQRQVVDCSHFVVFTIKEKIDEAHIDRFIARTAEVRGIPAQLRGTPTDGLKGYRDLMVNDVVKGPRSAVAREWAARQAYIALGNLMTSAALLGVDACPMEGIDPAAYDQILGLAGSGYATVVACAVGYRAAGDKYASLAKVRFARDEVVVRR